MDDIDPMPNYHISLWRAPADPPYICLLCHDGSLMDLPGITTHLASVHDGATPIPSPMTQQPPELQPPVEETARG